MKCSVFGSGCFGKRRSNDTKYVLDIQHILFVYSTCVPVKCAGQKQAIGSPTYCLVETRIVKMARRITE